MYIYTTVQNRLIGVAPTFLIASATPSTAAISSHIDLSTTSVPPLYQPVDFPTK